MHLAAVDHMANNGVSFIHRARPLTKIIMALLFLAGIIFTSSLLKLGVLLVVLVGMIALSRVNIRELLHLALYPVFFSLIFAFIRAQTSWEAGAVVVLKAVSAAMSMLLLITTTSYTDIFSMLSYVMPIYPK